jgi:hypothetical protein
LINPNDVDSYFDRRDWADLYGADAQVELETLFEAVLVMEGLPQSQAHLRAVEWAETRCADLIQGIKDTTVERVRSLVAQTIQDGRTVQELKKAITDGDTFSARRAETIARTEIAKSLGEGSRQAAVHQGRDEKKWQLGAGDACDICSENDTGEWLPIDDAFPSGDKASPAHPNCRCNVVYRTAALHEED